MSKDYDNVFIDEAHAFRSEQTDTYDKLAQICRGKRVVLLTATPFNNAPKDILSQIKLFQNAKKSHVPNVPDLESFFTQLEDRTKHLDKQKDRNEYMRIVKENSKKIREQVLKYFMVRRTRSEIQKYFATDLSKQGIRFPEVEDPKPVFYQLNEEEDKRFDRTAELIAKELKYARYTPLLYKKRAVEHEQGQRNLKGFMKTLLIKRLESSFYAFEKTVGRFIWAYEGGIKAFEQGSVYFSEKHLKTIFEHLDDDNDDVIQQLVDEGKASACPAEDFSDNLKKDLDSDLRILRDIHEMWANKKSDPKLNEFVRLLETDARLKKNKIIVFTESKETATYLEEQLKEHLSNEVLLFTGSSRRGLHDTVIENFDANAKTPKDDYRILIATEVLAEGVNLHRSNVVINYDLPWNPTRLMQRVGRINRIGTKFKKIYVFNFFPTQQANDQIKLKEIAAAKVHQFITLLGTDARLLTEDENIEAHGLFDRLTSKKTITDADNEEESELKYRQIIRDIRDKESGLFEKIKCLPKKARVAKKHTVAEHQLLTYFRKGKLKKFFLVSDGDSEEVDFMRAAQLLEAQKEELPEEIPTDFWDKLQRNKNAFKEATTEKKEEPPDIRGYEQKLRKELKAMLNVKDSIPNVSQYTEEQTNYIKDVMKCLDGGTLPKRIITKTYKALKNNAQPPFDSQKKYELLKKQIPEQLMKPHASEVAAATEERREVILSAYLIK